MRYTYCNIETFSTARNGFWTHQFWCLLELLSLFFTSSIWAKCFPLMIFSSGETTKKKSLGGRYRVNTEGGAHIHAIFGQKLLNTQPECGQMRLLVHNLSWSGQTRWIFKQKLTDPNAASHNNASWNADTDGFPGHSPSGGSLSCRGSTLQKIILVFCPPP